MSDRTVAICTHCLRRIVLVPFSPPRWMHQHEGASFQDGQHQYCKVTVAEPDTNPASNRISNPQPRDTT